MKRNTDPVKESFSCLEETLDALIECQREEQDAILKRNPKILPIITGRMDQNYMKLEGYLKAVGQLAPRQEGETDPYEQEKQGCRERIAILQELALQNHLLLEHGVKFLRDIFATVLGNGPDNAVYNQLGMMPGGFVESGSLLDVRV